MSKETALQPVGPRDCALGMAIPLDVDAFTRDLDNVDKDFAKHFVRMNTPQKPVSDEFYRDAFRAAADGIERECATVERRGVTVARNLTLDRLPRLFAHAKVVTIFAHWRFTSIKEEDIINPSAILDLLRSSQEPIHRLIRKEVLLRHPDYLEQERAERQSLATLLNEIASAANDTYLRSRGSCSEGILEVNPAQTILHRVTFESAFAGFLRAADAIELSDGMHTVSEFAESIPATFDGVLDLTVCHSMVLGGAVKAKRPHCTVALGRCATDLRVRIALYEIAVRMIRGRRKTFMDVLTTIATRPQYPGGPDE